ncbi:MAG: hypothetical protein MAGBODY4_01208 [Candidatus Marinimicrobia bacterium]|nr:hypothetical protein [Candidatus Neomarinimicrobiota bacterium]
MQRLRGFSIICCKCITVVDVDVFVIELPAVYLKLVAYLHQLRNRSFLSGLILKKFVKFLLIKSGIQHQRYYSDIVLFGEF